MGTRASFMAAVTAALLIAACGGGGTTPKDGGPQGTGGTVGTGGTGGNIANGTGGVAASGGAGADSGGSGGGSGGHLGSGGGSGSGGRTTPPMCPAGPSCAAGQSCGLDCMGNSGSVSGLAGPGITCTCANGSFACRVVYEGTVGTIPPLCPAGSACTSRCNVCQLPSDGNTKVRTCFCSADLLWVCA